MKTEFEYVDGRDYEPWLGDRILRDGDRVACLWPDGSKSRHKVTVVRRRRFIEHLGSTPFDDWTERTEKKYASIQVRHRGALIEIPLGRENVVAPKCRLIRRKRPRHPEIRPFAPRHA